MGMAESKNGTIDWRQLVRDVIASLNADEREGSIVYMEQRVIPAGDLLAWAGISHRFKEPLVIAFIDLEPAMNWSHRARYVVLGIDGAILHTQDTDKPPFLKGVSPALRLIHRGTKAPVWSVVAPPI